MNDDPGCCSCHINPPCGYCMARWESWCEEHDCPFDECGCDNEKEPPDWHEAVEHIAPSNSQLRASVIRFPAPQEWFDES